MSCQCPDDWGFFLHIRHLNINRMLKEGQSYEDVAKAMSMDPEQVELIVGVPRESLIN